MPGVCLACAWIVPGVCLDCAWRVPGVCLGTSGSRKCVFLFKKCFKMTVINPQSRLRLQTLQSVSQSVSQSVVRLKDAENALFLLKKRPRGRPRAENALFLPKKCFKMTFINPQSRLRLQTLQSVSCSTKGCLTRAENALFLPKKRPRRRPRVENALFFA